MNPTYYILVSTNSSGPAEITKYTNQEGTETELITIPAGSTDYKVDNLIYGFKIWGDSGAFYINIDLYGLNTHNMTNMNYMFGSCSALTSLDVSNFNTSKVTDMTGAFAGCGSLTSLDLSSFDTSNVTNMSAMFTACEILTSLDLSNFDTSNVTDMNYMFSSCESLNHIKCKQAFKDWCWTNQDTISLPDAMKSGGSGRWEIVG